MTPKLIELAGFRPDTAPAVKISTTMRITLDNTSGVWDPQLQAIIILRRQLLNPEAYAGTLIHELIHATTHLADESRSFEMALTQYLGKVAISALRRSGDLI